MEKSELDPDVTPATSSRREAMTKTDEEFALLTTQYVDATQARLALIKADLPATPDAWAYRELASRERELGSAWDAELARSFEDQKQP
jgi:hypothetical protein